MNYRQFLQLLLVFAVVFAVAFTISACKKTDNPTSPTDNGNGGIINLGTLGSLYLPNLPPVSGVLGALDLATIYSGHTYDVKFGMAGFYASVGSSSTIYAGDVKVNGSSLDTLMSGANVFYLAPTSKNPLGGPVIHFADTSVANFVVAGSGPITGFSASINTPSPAVITFPGLTDSVSKSANFTIMWTGASSADSVMVIAMDGSMQHTFSKIGAPNTGSYTIQASDMSSFTAGEGGTVVLVKYRYTVTNQGGKNYALVAETINTATVKFY